MFTSPDACHLNSNIETKIVSMNKLIIKINCAVCACAAGSLVARSRRVIYAVFCFRASETYGRRGNLYEKKFGGKYYIKNSKCLASRSTKKQQNNA